MSSRQGKILVIRGGAIGDFILTLPAIAALREQFPSAELEVMGYPHIAQLALAGGLVAKVRSIESRSVAGFFARNGELAADIAAYFSEFNLIISYLYDPDGIFRANVARCTKGQFIAGPHRPDKMEESHATEVFLRPLERLAIFDAATTPRLAVSKAFETTAQSGRWLAAHPGSGSESKNWPEAKWRELLDKIVRETALNILITGGEAERDRLEPLARALPPARVKLMQSAPLAELARWLASCAGYIGHDSGISHLAAAVGLPCVILWGETDENVWRPRGETVIVLRDEFGLAELSVKVVSEQLKRLLDQK